MEIKLNEQQIKALQNGEDITIKAPCKKKKEFPQIGDTYWYISDCDVLIQFDWFDEYNQSMYDYGNIYQTEDEAIKARDIQLAKTRVKRAIAKANDGWEPEWGEDRNIKYSIRLESIGDSIILVISDTRCVKNRPNWMYMKSEEIAKQILEEYKEDLELIFSE